MKIVAGGYGRVALRVSRLVRKRGDRVRSLTRNPAHREDIDSGGGEPVVCDLEQTDERELAHAIAGADAEQVTSHPAHTIVRPGWLTDDPARGLVRAGAHVDDGEISRDDVAAVLALCLDDTDLAGVTFEVVAGDEPLESALAACRSLSATRGGAPA
jgi:uncharacterized protein YbjT (DUF2867 family)